VPVYHLSCEQSLDDWLFNYVAVLHEIFKHQPWIRGIREFFGWNLISLIYPQTLPCKDVNGVYLFPRHPGCDAVHHRNRALPRSGFFFRDFGMSPYQEQSLITKYQGKNIRFCPLIPREQWLFYPNPSSSKY